MATTTRSIPGKAPAARFLVDVPGAAERTATSVSYIRRLVNERRVKYYKVGGHVRFDVRDLDAFIDAGAVEAIDR